MDFRNWSKQTRIIVISAAVVLVIGAVVAAMALSRDGDKPGKTAAGLKPAAEQDNGTGDGGNATDEGGAKKPTETSGDGTQPGGTASNGGTNGSGGTGGDSGAAGTEDDPAQTPATTPKGEARVMIKWWNDTVSKKPAAPEVMISGGAAWRAPADKASTTGYLNIATSKALVLVVYPDGRSGKKIEVPVVFTKDMKPASEQDAIHVEVSDGSVRVLGTPVDNFDRSYQRF